MSMLQPKRTKYRKAFKGRIHGHAKGGFSLNFGSFGLKALEPERVTSRQIEAARRLPNVPTGHKCARLHGHSWRIEVAIEGPVGNDTGWVMDYADLKAAFQPIHDRIDHNYLNEIRAWKTLRVSGWPWGSGTYSSRALPS